MSKTLHFTFKFYLKWFFSVQTLPLVLVQACGTWMWINGSGVYAKATTSLAIYQMSTRMWPLSRKCCSAAAQPSPGWKQSMWVSQVLLMQLLLLLARVSPPDNHLSSGAACAPVNRHSHYQRRAMWRANRTGSRCQGELPQCQRQRALDSKQDVQLEWDAWEDLQHLLWQTGASIACPPAWAWPWQRSRAAASTADWSPPAAAVASGQAPASLRRLRWASPMSSSSVGCIAMFDSAPISQSTFGIAADQKGERKDADWGFGSGTRKNNNDNNLKLQKNCLNLLMNFISITNLNISLKILKILQCSNFLEIIFFKSPIKSLPAKTRRIRVCLI